MTTYNLYSYAGETILKPIQLYEDKETGIPIMHAF